MPSPPNWRTRVFLQGLIFTRYCKGAGSSTFAIVTHLHRITRVTCRGGVTYDLLSGRACLRLQAFFRTFKSYLVATVALTGTFYQPLTLIYLLPYCNHVSEFKEVLICCRSGCIRIKRHSYSDHLQDNCKKITLQKNQERHTIVYYFIYLFPG